MKQQPLRGQTRQERSEMSEFRDTNIILHELEQLFNRDDDIRDILDIKKMQNEIEIQCNAHLKDTKEIIRAMAENVALKEADIKAPTQAEHLATLKLLSNKENLIQQTEAISRNIEIKRQSIAKMAATGISLKERAAEFNISTDMADSRTAYAISLYAKISNITWDYSLPTGKLGGCIGNDARKELTGFELDTAAVSPYDTANALWDMIESNQNDEEEDE